MLKTFLKKLLYFYKKHQKEREIIRKNRIKWYPNVAVIETKEDIIPPIGSIRTENNGTITYKELRKFSGYTIDKGSFVKWQGVECEGNPENQKTIYLNEQNMSVCELCKNQMKCIFNNGSANDHFQMKEEYSEIDREIFNVWVHQNSKKLKVETKNPQRY